MKPDHFFGGRASPVYGDCVCLLRSYPPSYLIFDILFPISLVLIPSSFAGFAGFWAGDDYLFAFFS